MITEYLRVGRFGDSNKSLTTTRATLSPSAEPVRVFEHYSIPAHDTGQEPVLERGETIKSNKIIVPEGAVLLSKLNPEINRVWLPNPRGDAPQIASTEFLCSTPAGATGRALLYSLLRSEGFRQKLQAMVTGTSKSHQRVSPSALIQTEVLTGAERIFEEFETVASPFLVQTITNRAEISTLAAIRDALLPKLISGELRVRHAETFCTNLT